ncbi:MAG: type I methionyl aminopeptidase [Brooklawnia sp.]|uniref:type I methionyl aminopeptidase n=1 Tax=Brooklawnia sp. TaxID=2699740 RepID=UPI003C755BF6
MIARGVEVKSIEQIRLMRRAGLVVAEALAAMGEAIRPGITTAELDAIARTVLTDHNAASSFLDYGAEWGYPPYPATACISVNEGVVHGVPGNRKLASGDLVSIDFGAILDGWHGDAARTFCVGEVSDAAAELVERTRLAMWAGIAAAAGASRVGDISHAIELQAALASRPLGIVREYTGHGIGTAMHQPPDVPNFGRPRRGPRLSRGMCLAIEPIFTLGSPDTVTMADEWTVVTRDGSWAAHWENTVALTEDGPWVLTEPDGGRAELAARGVKISPLAS